MSDILSRKLDTILPQARRLIVEDENRCIVAIANEAQQTANDHDICKFFKLLHNFKTLPTPPATHADVDSTLKTSNAAKAKATACLHATQCDVAERKTAPDDFKATTIVRGIASAHAPPLPTEGLSTTSRL